MIKAIIFDLDDTLYDCTNTLTPIAEKLSCRKIIPLLANLGIDITPEKCYDLRQKLFPEHGPSFRNITKAMLKELGVSEDKLAAITEEAHTSYHSVHVEGIKVFEGVHDLLKELKKKYRLYLVTGGDPEQQKKKVQFLGIGNYFRNIYYHDTVSEAIQTKRDYFGYVIDQTDFHPEHILVVGDRLDLEIRIGRELGMKTARLDFGKYRVLAEREDYKDKEADYVIKKITDIIKVLEKL